MLLYELVNTFDKNKLGYTIVGGYALALHGLVRATMDVDLVLSLRLEDYELAEKLLNQCGLTSRIPVRAKDIISMRKEFIENRNLIAWSFVDTKQPHRQVDLLITEDLRKLKTELVSVGQYKIRVVTLKELLSMKKKSGRPQDLVDIKNIEDKIKGKV